MATAPGDVHTIWTISRRFRRWLRRIVWIIVWCVGVVTVGKIHLDSVRMYIIISAFFLIFASLGRMRRVREVNAYGEGPSTLDVVSRNTNTNTSSDTSPTAAQLPIFSFRREYAVFTALRNIGSPQALRAVRDKEFQELILHTPSDSIQCCCGSGTRFARCCRVIQDALRQSDL
ncbi:hypothetical protein LSM04_004933 [Trypanosoma melophagium]|uniref:uncharacterized protein n=1 Tax=Trypanosoma melophagium TaxID=715481 RepID=UPI00351A2E30|nr:hypothetical protein LSM04_004933 [Trypanosoma melophagium]